MSAPLRLRRFVLRRFVTAPSAPCHKGREVTRFLGDHGIEVLPWPGNSPDMNPIENLWAILKSQMKKKTITNKQQLIEELISAWARNASMLEHCRALVRSMPERVKKLKMAKGSFTKY